MKLFKPHTKPKFLNISFINSKINCKKQNVHFVNKCHDRQIYSWYITGRHGKSQIYLKSNPKLPNLVTEPYDVTGHLSVRARCQARPLANSPCQSLSHAQPPCQPFSQTSGRRVWRSSGHNSGHCSRFITPRTSSVHRQLHPQRSSRHMLWTERPRRLWMWMLRLTLYTQMTLMTYISFTCCSYITINHVLTNITFIFHYNRI